MKLALKIVGGLIVTVLVLAVAAAFVVTNTHWGHEQVRTRVLALLNNGVAHGTVHVDSLEGDLWHGITLKGVSIVDSAGAPFVKAEEVHTGYNIRPFLSRKIDLNGVRFVRPEVVLDKAPNGIWNYDRIFPVSKSAAPADTSSIQFGDWVVFHDVQIVDGHLTVRLPWHAADSLSAKARDSAIKVVTDPASRLVVVAREGGYQQVQDFRSIFAHLPLARIAQPGFKTRLFKADSARMIAYAFAPPPADVRQLAGTFESNKDSVWFTVPELKLPASSATLAGRYNINTGDLALHGLGKPVALADVRFLEPALPTDGHASLELALAWVGKRQDYVVHNLDLVTGTATATGDIGITRGDTFELHQTDVTFAGVNTRLIEQLVKGLDIPRQGVVSGHAKIDGVMSAMQINGDVTFNDSKTGVNRVLAIGEVGTANGVIRARDLHVTLSPVQVRLAEMAMKNFPLQGTLTGSAVLNGASDTRLVASQLQLTHLDRGERTHVSGTGTVRLGKVPYLFLDAIAEPLSLVTAGRFAPAAGLRGNVTGPIKVDGTTRDLAIRSTLVTPDGGVIEADGRLDLASKDVGYNLNVMTKLFNANLVAEKAPRTSLSAMLTAEGRGFAPETMQGNFDASLSTSTIDTLAVDSSRVRVRVASGVATIDTFALSVPGASANVSGAFGLAKTANASLAYRVQVDSIGKLARYLPLDTSIVKPRPGPVAERLAAMRADSVRMAQKLAVARAAGVAPLANPIVIDTPASFKRDSLAGSALIEGKLKGGLGGFDLQGTLIASNIVALGNTVNRAKAYYVWNRALTPEANFDVRASIDSVSAAGFLLDSVALSGTYLKPGGNARVSIFQNSRRDYAMNAAYAIYPDRNELRFGDLRLRFDSTRWASAHPGALLWGQPGIEIDSLDLRNNVGGRIFANGKVPSAGVANLDVDIANFEVGDLMGLLQSDLALRGLLSTKMRVIGSSGAPLITGTASVAEATYGGTVIPDVAATFHYAEQKLTAKADATYVGRRIATATAMVPVNLAASGVTGPRLLDAPASADIEADSLPLDLASKFTDAVSEVRGYTTGSASLRGPITKPQITGDIVVADGGMRVTALGVRRAARNGSVHVHNDSVTIDSIAASSGGRFRISGGVGIATPATPSFDLKLTADNAKVLDNVQGHVLADANITVKGPYSAVDVSGSARIRQGVLYIPKPDTREMLNTNDGAVYAVVDTSNAAVAGVLPTQSQLVNNLKMDLTLAVDRDTWVRNTEANVEIYSDGDLRIEVDRKRGKLTLDGVVNTDRGQYEVLSKRFEIKRGSATFVGTREIDPILQLTGEYAIKQASQQALNIRVLIGGTLLAPKLTLESDAQPPISQSDLLSYLAFGSESGSLLQVGGSSVSGATAGGGLVGTSAALATKQLAGVALGVFVNDLEGRAARSLGADVLNITPSNIPTELASSNFGTLTTFLKGTQLEFGKYVNTQTFVGLQLQATTSPGFRIERRIGHNGLSLESTLQPRFFLPQPSLEIQNLKKANAFGLFLIRRWRF
jgi:autotransporter translocation and assembly factor TamB